MRRPNRCPSKSIFGFMLCIVAGFMTSGCSTTSTVHYEVSPLVVASCPRDLGALPDKLMGSSTDKLVEVIGVYRKCAAAALGDYLNQDKTR